MCVRVELALEEFKKSLHTRTQLQRWRNASRSAMYRKLNANIFSHFFPFFPTPRRTRTSSPLSIMNTAPAHAPRACLPLAQGSIMASVPTWSSFSPYHHSRRSRKHPRPRPGTPHTLDLPPAPNMPCSRHTALPVTSSSGPIINHGP